MQDTVNHISYEIPNLLRLHTVTICYYIDEIV